MQSTRSEGEIDLSRARRVRPRFRRFLPGPLLKVERLIEALNARVIWSRTKNFLPQDSDGPIVQFGAPDSESCNLVSASSTMLISS